MKTLSLTEMENIEGGSCTQAWIGLGLAFAGGFAVGSIFGAAIFAASFIYASYGMATSC